MVNKVRMKETFCELVSIYAASKKEREVCDYLKCKLKDLGALIIVEDSAGEKTGGNSGNLIAIFPETQEGLPSIAITGHMDCVEKCKNIKPILKGIGKCRQSRSYGDTRRSLPNERKENAARKIDRNIYNTRRNRTHGFKILRCDTCR